MLMQDIRVVSIVGGQSIEEQGFKLRQVRKVLQDSINCVFLVQFR